LTCPTFSACCRTSTSACCASWTGRCTQKLLPAAVATARLTRLK
jgi:hypothetical protein